MTAPADHVFTVNPLFEDVSNPSKLTDRLWLAGAATARQHDVLRSLGITAVVNLTPDDYGCEEAGFKVCHIQIDDAAALDTEPIVRFLSTMDEWERDGDVVLIHCHAGISRTSSFAIAWLMHRAGASHDTDLRAMWSRFEDAVGAARPIIMPHYLLKRAILNHFDARAA
jgi:predicted protein tyrosine phosphatase